MRSASGPSPLAPSIAASTSAARGTFGSRRARRGANDPSGTRAAPSACRRNERIAASLRAIVAGASLRRSRPSSAAYSESTRASTPFERRLARVEPRDERLEVEPVRAARRVREGRRSQEALEGVHAGCIRRGARIACPWTTGRSSANGLRGSPSSTARTCSRVRWSTSNAEYGQHELARTIAAHAYRRGARFVDVWYFDPFVKRARIEHADDESLDYVPPWYGQRALGLGELHGAHISIAGATQPGLLDDLDPARVGRDLLPRVKENFGVINDKTTNWLVMPGPTEGWARQVYPDADDPLARLWEEISYVTRLDADDPVAAWRERFAQTGDVGRRLSELELDAVHFEGPGTDLTVGLLPTSNWRNATETTVDGLGLRREPAVGGAHEHARPGASRGRRPLDAAARAERRDADRGHPRPLRGRSCRRGRRGRRRRGAAGAHLGRRRSARLGEVALVDREGRIGPLGTVFYNTLLDENAASHLALGGAYESLVGEEDVERINRSELHLDFMIGSDEVVGHRHHARTAHACRSCATATGRSSALSDPASRSASA